MIYYCEKCKHRTDFRYVESYKIEYTSTFSQTLMQDTIKVYACGRCGNQMTTPHSRMPDGFKRLS